MPRQTVRLLLAVLILASLFGGRSLVANLTDGTQHVVKPGETLSEIAAQHGVTVDQLIALNSIADPNRLADGQTLKLPGPPAGATAAAPGTPPASGSGSTPSAQDTGGQPPTQADAQASTPASEYVVQTGDTLSEIAKSLGVSVRALLEANELDDPNRLRVGQKLTVPAGATPPAPTAPVASASPVPQPGAPAAGSAPPVAPDEVSVAIDRLAQQYGVDPALVRALAWIETDGKPQRLDLPGSLGHLTVTDKTFEYIQQTLVSRPLDRANPIDNLEAGIAYIASMLKWGGDESLGLAAFLQGPGSIRTNGVRPAIDEQVQRILALRDRLRQDAPAPTMAGPVQAAPIPPTAGTGAGAGSAQAAPVPTTAGAVAEARLPSSDAAANLVARAIGAARGVAGSDARIGISGRNLVSGERLSVGDDQSFPAASVGKLALLVEAYRQSVGGGLVLNDAQRADIRSMIVSSDNEAANRLMELLTTRAVNANLQALGLVGTRLGNPFGLSRATGEPANVTTPGDMARLMELLATEQLVSAEASREMRGLLLQSNDGSKLRRGLPPEARLAHKSGWYEGVANDVGIVAHAQGGYILSVFTEGIADPEVGNQTIAAVSEAVYRAWGPTDPGTTATSEARRPR